MAVKKLRDIYQIKVTLEGAKPPIWRRLLVTSDMKLSDLHEVIQDAMGWYNYHMHQFIANGAFYGVPDDEFGDFGPDMRDEKKHRLSDLLKKEKDSIRYEYDFGDSWFHKIILEKVLPFDKDTETPRCIKGKRACPPEDCGGIWGYAEILEIMKDPSHPEHEDTAEWVGEHFDPEEFDVEAINLSLKKY